MSGFYVHSILPKNSKHIFCLIVDARLIVLFDWISPASLLIGFFFFFSLFEVLNWLCTKIIGT